jgi:hypothetical protein
MAVPDRDQKIVSVAESKKEPVREEAANDSAADLRAVIGFEVDPDAQPLVNALHRLDVDIGSIPVQQVTDLMRIRAPMDAAARMLCLVLDDREACDRFVIGDLMPEIDTDDLAAVLPLVAFERPDGHVLLCFLGAVGFAVAN